MISTVIKATVNHTCVDGNDESEYNFPKGLMISAWATYGLGLIPISCGSIVLKPISDIKEKSPAAKIKLSKIYFRYFFLKIIARTITKIRIMSIDRRREINCEKVSNRVPCQKWLMNVRSWRSIEVEKSKIIFFNLFLIYLILFFSKPPFPLDRGLHGKIFIYIFLMSSLTSEVGWVC